MGSSWHSAVFWRDTALARHRLVKMMSCKEQCGVNTTSSQLDVASRCQDDDCQGYTVSKLFFASATSSQHDTVSTRNRVNTKPCHHDAVSKRRRDNTKYCQYDIVSRRHRAITTPCQGGTVSIRRRVETNIVSRRRPAKTAPRQKAMSCKDGTVSKRWCAKTSSCHHHAVSKTALWHHDDLPRRRNVKTTHDIVLARRRFVTTMNWQN